MNCRRFIIGLAMVMIAQSCRMENSPYAVPESPKSKKKSFESIMVSPDNLLYVRIGGKSGKTRTKSSNAENSVSLESLLDDPRLKHWTLMGTTWCKFHL